MRRRFPVVLSGTLLLAVGCGSQTQPSGTVDTSDPNKTITTMTPAPKGGGTVGVPKTGPGPKSPGGK